MMLLSHVFRSTVKRRDPNRMVLSFLSACVHTEKCEKTTALTFLRFLRVETSLETFGVDMSTGLHSDLSCDRVDVQLCSLELNA